MDYEYQDANSVSLDSASRNALASLKSSMDEIASILLRIERRLEQLTKEAG